MFEKKYNDNDNYFEVKKKIYFEVIYNLKTVVKIN